MVGKIKRSRFDGRCKSRATSSSREEGEQTQRRHAVHAWSRIEGCMSISPDLDLVTCSAHLSRLDNSLLQRGLFQVQRPILGLVRQ